MRNVETYLHNLPFYQALDRLNAQLTKAYSLRTKPAFSAADLAWFRKPLSK